MSLKTYTPDSAAQMYIPGRIAARTLDAVEEYLRTNPYRTTLEIEKLCRDFIESNNAIAECVTFVENGQAHGYATSISVNDVACHGAPSDYLLQDGDLVSVDVVVRHGEWLSDTTRVFGIGKLSQADQDLMRISREATYAGMRAVKLGAPISAIADAIVTYCNTQRIDGISVSIVPEYCGHGISHEMHELPRIHALRAPCEELLVPYFYFTIEPIITSGANPHTFVNEETGEIRTRSGRKAKHTEHTMGLDANGNLMVFSTRDEAHEREILAAIS